MKNIITLATFVFLFSLNSFADAISVQLTSRDSNEFLKIIKTIATKEERVDPDNEYLRYQRFIYKIESSSITFACVVQWVDFEGEDEPSQNDCYMIFDQGRARDGEYIIIEENGVVSASFTNRTTAFEISKKVKYHFKGNYVTAETIPTLGQPRAELTCSYPARSPKNTRTCKISAVLNSIPGEMPEVPYCDEKTDKSCR